MIGTSRYKCILGSLCLYLMCLCPGTIEAQQSQLLAGGCDTSCLQVSLIQKISSTEGNFNGTLLDNNSWPPHLANLGDLNNDGYIDVAAGSTRDADGGTQTGAVYILFLDDQGLVLDHQKISSLEGGFTGEISSYEHWSGSVTNLGDVDGDGVTDIGVGQYDDDDGGNNKGSFWILFLNTDGTVKDHQKIGDNAGNFSGILSSGDQFGTSSTSLGDFDNDGIPDVAVGASNDRGNGFQRGALYLLYLNSDGTVKDYDKIGDQIGGFTGVLEDRDKFGRRIENIGDLDGDGISDLIVASRFDDDGIADVGALWVLFMNDDGTVNSQQKISALEGGLDHNFISGDYFGSSIATIPDLNCDGIQDIIVGNTNPSTSGSFLTIFLNNDGTVNGFNEMNESNINVNLDAGDLFGYESVYLGDINGDGYLDFATSAHLDDDGGIDRGALYILTYTDSCAQPCLAGTAFEEEICIGDTLRFEVNSGVGYQWSPTIDISDPSVIAPLFYPSVSTEYTVTYSDDNNCQVEDTLTIMVIQEIESLDLGTDDSICRDEEIVLSVSGIDGVYQWQDGSSDMNFHVSAPGIYWLEIAGACNTVRDSILITSVDCECDFDLPNAFSPNGDLLNDEFRLVNSELESAEIFIYNRWGNLVFNDIGVDFKWDGTYLNVDQELDNYAYYMIGRCPDGSRIFDKGNITLVR